jgi:hypothetical protein
MGCARARATKDMSKERTTMMSNYEDGLELDEGLIYNVEFDDGTTRRLRKIVPYLRGGHPWVDMDTREVVIQSWLIIPGNKGPRQTRFKDPDTGTPAFGGAFVTRMALAIKLGGTVSWAFQVGRNRRTKTGVVEEIVPSKGMPDQTRFPRLYRASGIGGPQNHKSFVLRVPGKTSDSAEAIYWPRVSSLTIN